MDTLFLSLILIAGSFIFSASEIAIFSLSRLQLRHIREHSDKVFRRIRILVHDSIGFLITVLLFNELLNITLGALLTSSLIEPIEADWKIKTFLGILVTTPVTLFFCELTPKVVATRSNRAVISVFLPIVYGCYCLTKPLVAFIKFFLPKQQVKELHQLHEEDFLILAEEQTETGHLHETELELIKNVFQMDDMRIEQLAVPLKKIVTIPSNITVEQAANTLLRGKIYSRVPIYGKSRDDIVGVLLTKDLVEIKVNPKIKNEPVTVMAKEPLIVAGNLTLETLFRKMKNKKVQVAFTKNEQGRITGMVTLQDILDIVIEEAFEE